MKFYVNEIKGRHYYFNEKTWSDIRKYVWNMKTVSGFLPCNMGNIPSNERWIFAAESCQGMEETKGLYLEGHPNKTQEDFNEAYSEYIMNKYIND